MLMISSNKIQITNQMRQKQRLKQIEKIKLRTFTPPKSVYRKYLRYKLSEKAQQFGYDYEPHQSKTLKYLLEDFEGKTVRYFGNDQKPKVLKNKDKYEKNLQLGKPFKKNPLIKIFNRVQHKIQQGDKASAFEKIKRLAF